MSDGFSYSASISEKSNNDIFGRQRMSQPFTIFDSKQIADKQPLFWDDQLVSGSGGASTYNANQASTTLSVSGATAAVRVRQTFRKFNYQPGKTQQILLTGVFGDGSSGIIKRIGCFDNNNGLFFEQSGTTMNVNIRSKTSGSVVDTAISQSNWNLDKMDGLGPSGITFEPLARQIFVIEFEWLGVGTVRFGLKINGTIYYVHEINHTNSGNMVYMSTPNLPLRYEIVNTGSGGANSLVHICSAVISEAGNDKTGFPLSVNRDATGLTTLNNSSTYPLIAIRLKTGYSGATIDISSISVICTSTAAYKWAIILNPTVTGTALSFSSITNSAIEADNATTNATTVTGGTVLDSGYSQANNEGSTDIPLQNKLTLGSNIAGVGDIIVLAVQRITGTTETFLGSMTWNETV